MVAGSVVAADPSPTTLQDIEMDSTQSIDGTDLMRLRLSVLTMVTDDASARESDDRTSRNDADETDGDNETSQRSRERLQGHHPLFIDFVGTAGVCREVLRKDRAAVV